jgi:hypothetical protein
VPLEGTANAGGLPWLVEEVSTVAVQRQSSIPLPPPTEIESAALKTVSVYLRRAGTQAASVLLGCPPLDGETRVTAELSNQLLGSAALCSGLLDLADEDPRW